MFLFITISIYNNVIQIHHNKFANLILKQIIHECLKLSRSVSQSKGHHQKFVLAILGEKCGFSFMTSFDTQKLKGTIQVQCSKQLSFLKRAE